MLTMQLKVPPVGSSEASNLQSTFEVNFDMEKNVISQKVSLTKCKIITHI
jgi:hypothetical protein